MCLLHHARRLFGGRLDGYEVHGRACERLANRLGVSGIGLFALGVSLHVGRRHHLDGTNADRGREIIAEFHMMIRRKAEFDLIAWIERSRASLVISFANGVAKDEAPVRAAITLTWSNGQTEGEIMRLKLVRR